jgi:hypothetical protein
VSVVIDINEQPKSVRSGSLTYRNLDDEADLQGQEHDHRSALK